MSEERLSELLWFLLEEVEKQTSIDVVIALLINIGVTDDELIYIGYKNIESDGDRYA